MRMIPAAPAGPQHRYEIVHPATVVVNSCTGAASALLNHCGIFSRVSSGRAAAGTGPMRSSLVVQAMLRAGRLPFRLMSGSVMIMDLPLGDIRVIDLTVARAGPTCVRQLADWGADVIRVEPPGEPAGGQAPRDAFGGSRHNSDFQHLHRNKRSLSLNLKSPAGREVLMRLVDTADVLIENM